MTKLSSLDKCLQLIDLLTENTHGLSLSELSGMTGFPKSTIHHILSTLRGHDYVDQNAETKRYFLGFKFLSVSSKILSGLDIRKTAFAHLRELHQKCRETVNLYILRNGRITLIDKIQKVGGLSLDTYVGFSTEPHAAASGKVLLSGRSRDEIRDMYRGKRLKGYGPRTITSMERLLDELDEIRRQGFAIDDEEYYEGVRCVAAPVRAGGKVVAALSITGSIFAVPLERVQGELKDLAVGTANEISSQLRW